MKCPQGQYPQDPCCGSHHAAEYWQMPWQKAGQVLACCFPEVWTLGGDTGRVPSLIPLLFLYHLSFWGISGEEALYWHKHVHQIPSGHTHSDCTLSAPENSAWECILLSTRENFPWRRVIALCTFPQFFIRPVAVSSSFTFLPRKDNRKRKERKWRLDFIPLCLQIECLSLPGLISIA